MSTSTVFESPYAQFLCDFGMISAARRADAEGFNRGWLFPGGKTYTEFIPFDCMMRTDLKHAEHLAEEQLKRYSPLRALVHESFATIEYSYRMANTVEGVRQGNEKLFIYNMRRNAKKYFPVSIDKIVVRDGWLVIKFISFDPIVPETIAKGESIAKEHGLRFRCKNRAPDQFDQQLRKLVAHELPKDDDWSRARLEFILKGIHQVAVHSALCRDNCNRGLHKFRGKVLGEDYKPEPKNSLPPRRIDPETGKQATHVCPFFSLRRKIEDLGREEWIEYSDFEEVDCTSQAEIDEMNAQIDRDEQAAREMEAQAA